MGNGWSSALLSLGLDAGPAGVRLLTFLPWAVVSFVRQSVAFLLHLYRQKLAQGGPKQAQGGPKQAQGGPKQAQGGPKQGRKKHRGGRKHDRQIKKQGGSEQRDNETPGGLEQRNKDTQEEPEQREYKTEAVPQQGFFPGLPNDVVLEHIATRIPWSSMYALVYVNQKWRSAIRSREMYYFRKLRGASQSMIVAPVRSCFDFSGFYDLQRQELWFFTWPQPYEPFFGMRERSFRSEGYLDFFPHRANLSSIYVCHDNSIAFVDGKLYAIHQSDVKEELRADCQRQEAHMLDVAACHATWNLCSSTMENGPPIFWVACNGKIYAFHSYQKHMNVQIFDSKSHLWTEIEYKPSYRHCEHNHQGEVAVLNKKIYVVVRGRKRMMVLDTTTEKWHFPRNTSVIALQHHYAEILLVVIQEKMYNFARSQVEVYNPESNSWTLVQRTVHKDFMGDREWSLKVKAVARYGSEIMVVLRSICYDFPDGRNFNLCKSVGFGKNGKVLEWEKFADFPVKYSESLDFLEL